MSVKINLKLSSLAVALLVAIGGCASGGNSQGEGADSEANNGGTSGRLNTVLERGSLVCGVNGELPGFSFVDEN